LLDFSFKPHAFRLRFLTGVNEGRRKKEENPSGKREEGRPKWEGRRGRGKREDPAGEKEEEKKKRQGKVFLASSDIH
jgi:hypothetical protein